jgi:branched-chain amino acid transport system ATP-binding protein
MGLSVWYGDAQALFEVSFQVRMGEVVAVVGRNGAGKTTLLKCIAGLVKASTGKLSFRGLALGGLRTCEVARAGVSLVRDGGQVFRSLTVRQNLSIGAALAKRRGREALPADFIIEQSPPLRDKGDLLADALSGGQRQWLALGVALVSNPSFLLLDEPSAGLAPPVVRELMPALGRAAADGRGVIVAEQNLSLVRDLTDQIMTMESGVLRS